MKSEKNSNGLVDVLSYAAETIKTLADANSVIGESIEKDGVTVIPISKLSVGFAGGGADIKSDRKKEQYPAGAGAKVTRTPVTLLVIDENGAHIIDVAEQPKSSKISETVFALAEQVKSMIDAKKKG